ncbi:MAG TPA: ATP-binding protein [Pyrinomonadaceae bacterium]
MSTELNQQNSFLEQTGGDTPPGHFAPRMDWTVMGETEHFVQFYEADAFLLNSLGEYICAAIKAGEAAIVVATGEHRAELERRLRKNGLDVNAALECGQLVLLDAAETLSKLMSDEIPDPGLFAEIIGDVIARAGQGRPRVRIYGEMVALLWTEGNYDGAICLEELWNDLKRQHSFALFCAYPMSGFAGEGPTHRLVDVCAKHSRVIPAESYTALNDSDERLREITLLQQKARLLEAEIAERKKVEELLLSALQREQAARAEAESATRLKDEFLATVSHELRTPLSAILGWSTMLRTGKFNQLAVDRALETIERNARSQAQIIEDLLDVSRIITGRLRLDLQPVNPVAVIEAAVESVRPTAEAKGINLDLILDESVGPLLCDPARLQQVMWNLLSNAVKFTPGGGRVTVGLRANASRILISVCDTGQGVSAQFLPFIFDRFRQADGSSTRRHGGLGLGLSIVRHFVEMHGGSVSADSQGVGMGTTFTVEFPA